MQKLHQLLYLNVNKKCRRTRNIVFIFVDLRVLLFICFRNELLNSLCRKVEALNIARYAWFG